MDCSLLGSTVHGISQVRILECAAISFSRGFTWPSNQTWVSYFASSDLALLADSLPTESVGKWYIYMEFPNGSVIKESAWNARGWGLIPGSRRSSGEGNDYPLQYFCLENFVDRGAWWASVLGSQRVGHNWVTNIYISVSHNWVTHICMCVCVFIHTYIPLLLFLWKTLMNTPLFFIFFLSVS